MERTNTAILYFKLTTQTFDPSKIWHLRPYKVFLSGGSFSQSKEFSFEKQSNCKRTVNKHNEIYNEFENSIQRPKILFRKIDDSAIKNNMEAIYHEIKNSKFRGKS